MCCPSCLVNARARRPPAWHLGASYHTLLVVCAYKISNNLFAAAAAAKNRGKPNLAHRCRSTSRLEVTRLKASRTPALMMVFNDSNGTRRAVTMHTPPLTCDRPTEVHARSSTSYGQEERVHPHEHHILPPSVDQLGTKTQFVRPGPRGGRKNGKKRRNEARIVPSLAAQPFPSASRNGQSYTIYAKQLPRLDGNTAEKHASAAKYRGIHKVTGSSRAPRRSDVSFSLRSANPRLHDRFASGEALNHEKLKQGPAIAPLCGAITSQSQLVEPYHKLP